MSSESQAFYATAEAYDAAANRTKMSAPADAMRDYIAAAECYLQADRGLIPAIRSYDNAAKCAGMLCDTNETIRLLTLSSDLALKCSDNSATIRIDRYMRIAELAASIHEFDTAIRRYRDAEQLAKFENLTSFRIKSLLALGRLSTPADAIASFFEAAILAHTRPLLAFSAAEHLLDAVLVGLQTDPSDVWERATTIDPMFADSRQGKYVNKLFRGEKIEHVTVCLDSWRIQQLRNAGFKL